MTSGATMALRRLRPAKAAECAMLSDLALRSKAYWGYDPVFVQACRDDLSVDPRDAKAGRVVVLVEDETPLGLYVLAAGERPHEAQINLLFVEPDAIGTGAGRALWDHLVAKARAEGYRRLRIESDPFALGFYQSMGACLSGKARSAVHNRDGSERFLPLLHYDL
jgi:GNAT superfamily N-acetyltransferase